MPLWGVYIPQFDEISVKSLVLVFCTLMVAPMGMKFGENHQDRPLSNLNNRRFALRAMLARNAAG